jgi:hypothetical protein
MKPLHVALALVLAVGGVAACTEKLAAPADCPALCPGGTATVVDTVLTAIPGADSTFFGYIPADSVPALPVSNGTPALDSRAVFRFAPRLDTVRISDTVRTYKIDSATVTIGLQERDTLLTGLSVALYRLPARIDTTISFDAVNAAITPGNFVMRIPIPDSLRTGTVVGRLYGDSLSRIAIPAADSGILSVALVLEAATPTGIRVSGYNATSNLTAFNTYGSINGLTGNAAFQNYARNLAFSTYVFAPLPPAPAGALVLGGAPSSRAVIRFPWPAKLRDSATIIRATLELVPALPVLGIGAEATAFVVQPLVADLGAKSPLDNNYPIGITIPNGATDTVRAEIATITRLWQGTSTRPRTIFLRSSPEGGSFGRPVFGSTATGVPPRLRITYLKPFKFENP